MIKETTKSKKSVRICLNDKQMIKKKQIEETNIDKEMKKSKER